MAASYRALLAVPSVGPLLIGAQTARIAQSMVSVAIVLFALHAYRSPQVAGFATFFSLFPGLLVSPIAGALLDRHGRIRLVTLDYVVALASMVLMGMLALAGMLPPWLAMLVAAIASLTTPLSGSGLRSLLPLIVPSHLWERANAIDSAGYIIASIVGPPLAAILVALWGGGIAFIVIGVIFGVAAAVIARAPDPPTQSTVGRSLLTEAWQGLVYSWHNPTLRGLGFSISTMNLLAGVINIVVPLIVIERLHLDETFVGLVFGVAGVAGIVSAIYFGRIDSRARERLMLALSTFAFGIGSAILLLRSDLVTLVFVMAVTGLMSGPLDIALFTIRQRRTDPAFTGRAFAVSMSFNAVGIPVGSAIAGVIAARSIESAVAFGVVACLIGGVMMLVMIPPSPLPSGEGSAKRR